MKRQTIAILALMAATLAHADNRGLKVVGVRTSDGQDVSLYENSYALLVGVSDYQAGWPRLPSIPREIADVEAALKANGFSTTTILDPDYAQLEGGFREFIRAYGYDPGNRLLFYFAGHGWSRRGGEQGYLVPVNAPDPNKDERGFLRKALTMTQILAWCKEMEARHALFLFDSCFSGTIFTTRSLPDHPPHITPLIAKPVRQFITAGDAGEEVPAKSVFTPLFIRALQGEADLTGDGYVTGTELGLFLREKAMYYQTGQTPQYGKIRDPRLDRGDFVFLKTPRPPRVESNLSTPRAIDKQPEQQREREANASEGAGPDAVRPPVRWDLHPDGRAHFYEVVMAEQMSWQAACALAESRTYRGLQGRAASITSKQEKDFVLSVLERFLGRTYRDHAVWVGGTKEHGQWQWTTGEKWDYTNWAPGEPTNSGPTDRNEYLLEMHWNTSSQSYPDGTWNDHGDHCRRPAVVIEYSER
ncbi:MAG: caspase family protein [Lentisphaerae bacterium]|nr:caspase family protein [Lentisphaerota bacterium]